MVHRVAHSDNYNICSSMGPGVAGQNYPPPELPRGKTGLGQIYPRGKTGLGYFYPLQATFTPPPPDL